MPNAEFPSILPLLPIPAPIQVVLPAEGALSQTKMAAPSGKNAGNLSPDKTVFFLCDMQERFRPAIKYFEDILEVAKRLVS